MNETDTGNKTHVKCLVHVVDQAFLSNWVNGGGFKIISIACKLDFIRQTER